MKKFLLEDPIDQLRAYRDIVFMGNDFFIFNGKRMLTSPSRFQKCNSVLENKTALSSHIGYGAWLPQDVYSLESDSVPLDVQLENINEAYKNNEEFRMCFLCVVFSGLKSYHVVIKNKLNIENSKFYHISFNMLPNCDEYFLARKISRVAGCYRNNVLQKLEYVCS